MALRVAHHDRALNLVQVGKGIRNRRKVHLCPPEHLIGIRPNQINEPFTLWTVDIGTSKIPVYPSNFGNERRLALARHHRLLHLASLLDLKADPLAPIEVCGQIETLKLQDHLGTNSWVTRFTSYSDTSLLSLSRIDVPGLALNRARTSMG